MVISIDAEKASDKIKQSFSRETQQTRNSGEPDKGLIQNTCSYCHT